MKCRFEFEMNNLKEIYEFGEVAKQTNGSVLLKSGKTVMLATVVMEKEMVDEDFLPLTVQYIEKSYAAGKIPGGFVKREQKPGDFETLTARIVDRALRPLFPKGYLYPTVITVMVLSADPESDLQVLALNAASAALFVSDIPVRKAVSGLRVAKVDGEVLFNPPLSKLKESTLDLYLAGTKEELLMIEMAAIGSYKTEVVPTTVDPLMDPTLAEEVITIKEPNAMKEEELASIIAQGKDVIQIACNEYEKYFIESAKEQLELELLPQTIDEDIWTYVEEIYAADIKEAVQAMAKSERNELLKEIAKKISEDDVAKEQGWEYETIYKVVEKYKRKIVREMILNEGKRADGRGLKDVRPIDIKTNILPSAHGSCLFTRGETQALVVCTIGEKTDAQMYEMLTSKGPEYEHFMVHYNFPPFSVGEAKPISAPGRRELGHGNLARRALEPVVDVPEDKTYRLVSEILESNGSSSMATVCGGALALKAANIDLADLVAGVAMGLIVEDDKYAILTDIMGLEDHDGDMDFKVAGTHDGVTAMQMDIKLGGVQQEILEQALQQAREARLHILKIMEEAAEKIEINEENLPSSHTITVHPSKIVDIIGQAGKTIKEIIEKFEVSIDIDRDKGKVKVTGKNRPKVIAACDYIQEITNKPKPEPVKFQEGDILKGKIKRTTNFGAFVELPGGVDGLLHISKLSSGRVERVEDVVNIGDEVEVEVLSQKGHKIELGLRQVLKKA
ncbi:polyribonucleotide nucleotidyltransferase [Nitratiruptor sp. SB155-2]|uniref:Polyribonucleotide nucleotidyltransferase n=1 Tax=Nitratiruptor sp. (strain SB155-2) TaxID=387092 RepID=PNP_NITSB|nr:polyribonucleotide nucleotidyltransferase [Nitratiruptor sp. SB155-2]A6Q4N2.1 RecName: Full=Polyribonucleotide nucleotidyltransferase; AltName: Full=Polynucleotide phosphorylase; Short=PNPase [Nitratiruptor sp. SB155-2]BAF70441.1 polyribonucleotide nucleotidyltransferase [Nitratiruptor sp. SB155-2]